MSAVFFAQMHMLCYSYAHARLLHVLLLLFIFLNCNSATAIPPAPTKIPPTPNAISCADEPDCDTTTAARDNAVEATVLSSVVLVGAG
jgi:hypothetical protein